MPPSGSAAVIVMGVPLAKKFVSLAVGAEVVPVSPGTANAVIGTKLITIHNDRNAAKKIFFSCVFSSFYLFYGVALGWVSFAPYHLRHCKKVYLSKRGVSWEDFRKCVEKIISLGYDRGEYLENPVF